jgi:hypothetical protein
MSQEPIQGASAAQGAEDHWAAWQARGAANDEASRRKLFVVAAMFVLGAVIFSGYWLLR